jgi:hypothetical protein
MLLTSLTLSLTTGQTTVDQMDELRIKLVEVCSARFGAGKRF